MIRDFDATDVRQRWLEGQVQALTPPRTLTERNWVQLMLADRYSIQFRVSRLTALEAVAMQYGKQFPHHPLS